MLARAIQRRRRCCSHGSRHSSAALQPEPTVGSDISGNRTPPCHPHHQTSSRLVTDTSRRTPSSSLQRLQETTRPWPCPPSRDGASFAALPFSTNPSSRVHLVLTPRQRHRPPHLVEASSAALSDTRHYAQTPTSLKRIARFGRPVDCRISRGVRPLLPRGSGLTAAETRANEPSGRVTSQIARSRACVCHKPAGPVTTAAAAACAAIAHGRRATNARSRGRNASGTARSSSGRRRLTRRETMCGRRPRQPRRLQQGPCRPLSALPGTTKSGWCGSANGSSSSSSSNRNRNINRGGPMMAPSPTRGTRRKAGASP